MDESQVHFDLHWVNQLIRSRRSIFPRQYTGEKIPREDVEIILENAHWAPNHGKTEPWLFKVFTGKGLEEFAQKHADLYRELTPPDKFLENKYQKLQLNPLKSSHVIAICLNAGTNPKIPEMEEVAAVACAVQNMHLTATAMGLAAYWSSGGMTYHARMKDVLGLDENQKCLGFFYLAKYEGPTPEGHRKDSWETKVEWIES
ncbi:MAG: nitroreductase [Bacteroidetes bacterium]|nr:nitroreductase [Bacteroidota bacterium]MCB0843184.1 nitroreductase [Bacteroidota bacterium]MCB0855931.1 nitroreductase [Bacteroidota bacterium]